MKKFIYFPSFSSKYSILKKDDAFNFPDLKTTRFYDDEYKEFKHNYFLLSAGEFYNKTENIRNALGLHNSVVFGDSGGYQIATGGDSGGYQPAKGAIKWQEMSISEREAVREKILHFLLNNCDIAMNLDIPPKLGWKGKFDECLKISYDNIKYFYDNEERKKSKVDFLNVLQCDESYSQYDEWYEKVKGFEFSGWSIGGTLNKFINGVYAVALLLQNGEFKNIHNKFLHFLGATNPFRFLFYATLQKNLNKYFPEIQITTDSSTPALQGSAFGNWQHSCNIKDWEFNNMKLPQGMFDEEEYNDDAELPCTINCPICSNINWKELRTARSEQKFLYASWHNLFITNKAIDNITKIAYSGSNVTQVLVGPMQRQMMNIIDEMFATPSDAIFVFNRDKAILEHLSNIMPTEGDER